MRDNERERKRERESRRTKTRNRKKNKEQQQRLWISFVECIGKYYMCKGHRSMWQTCKPRQMSVSETYKFLPNVCVCVCWMQANGKSNPRLYRASKIDPRECKNIAIIWTKYWLEFRLHWLCNSLSIDISCMFNSIYLWEYSIVSAGAADGGDGGGGGGEVWVTVRVFVCVLILLCRIVSAAVFPIFSDSLCFFLGPGSEFTFIIGVVAAAVAIKCVQCMKLNISHEFNFFLPFAVARARSCSSNIHTYPIISGCSHIFSCFPRDALNFFLLCLCAYSRSPISASEPSLGFDSLRFVWFALSSAVRYFMRVRCASVNENGACVTHYFIKIDLPHTVACVIIFQ